MKKENMVVFINLLMVFIVIIQLKTYISKNMVLKSENLDIKISHTNIEKIYIEPIEVINIISNEKAKILSIKKENNYWKGNIQFEGNLYDLKSYIKQLNENKVLLENYSLSRKNDFIAILNIKTS